MLQILFEIFYQTKVMVYRDVNKTVLTFPVDSSSNHSQQLFNQLLCIITEYNKIKT